MKKIAVSIFLAVLPLVSSAQLPKRANDLITKLNDWELDQQAVLQKSIREKREQIVTILKRELQSTTKAGDLEGALAIKKEIERLTKATIATTTDENASNESRVDHESTKPKLEWFVGKTWGSDIVMYKFLPNGEGIKIFQGSDFPMKWKVLESGAIEVNHNGAIGYVWIDSSRRAEVTRTLDRKSPRELDIRR